MDEKTIVDRPLGDYLEQLLLPSHERAQWWNDSPAIIEPIPQSMYPAIQAWTKQMVDAIDGVLDASKAYRESRERRMR